MVRRRGGGTPATVALERAGVGWTGRAYEHDPTAASFGMEAAEALGIDPARVLKTLVADVDGVGMVVAVVPADRRLDLKALAAAVGGKRAVMAEPPSAERVTGYAVGGISPLGQKRALPTVIEESAAAFATVLVSGGRRGFDVELAPDDLVALTGATLAAIATRPTSP